MQPNLYSKNMRYSALASLVSLALLVTSNHLCFARTNSTNQSQTKQVQGTKLEKLKKRVEEIGVGGEITVIRLDKRDFYGKVSNIEADGFQIVDVDSKQTISFKYTEIKKIKTGVGGKSLITGKRANHKNVRLISVAALGTLFVVLIVLLSNDR